MPARRRAVSAALLALLLSAAIAIPSDQPLLGEPAPDFELPTLDGERVHLEDLRGRVVVLHFGTGW